MIIGDLLATIVDQHDNLSQSSGFLLFLNIKKKYFKVHVTDRIWYTTLYISE